MCKLSSSRSVLIYLSAVFSLVFGKLSHAHAFGKSPEPSVVEIQLSDIGIVADFRFKVKEHSPHWFRMRFWFAENDQAERARIRKLLGDITVDKFGKPTNPGTPTPVKLEIFAICKGEREVKIYSQDVDPILASWGQGHFGKNVGSHILTPGYYRARLVNKRAAQELSSIRTTFEIFRPAKADFDPNNASTRSEPCQQ